MEDKRNLRDELKGLRNKEVVERLARSRAELEIAIINIEHDFNFGTIVRAANNFNVSRIHIIGRRKYNRRGAMCTDKYMEFCFWDGRGIVERGQNGSEGGSSAPEEANLRRVEVDFDRAVEEFFEDQKARGREVVAIENNTKYVRGGLMEKEFRAKTTLVFGGEGKGIPEEVLSRCGDVREIESFGSTRSINVGVAAGIAMWAWARQNRG
jgi:tRNA G18 (ribose-2'-O)-methylase SpoU